MLCGDPCLCLSWLELGTRALQLPEAIVLSHGIWEYRRMNRAKTRGCLLWGESRTQLCCCCVPFQTVVGFMPTPLLCGLPFIGVTPGHRACKLSLFYARISCLHFHPQQTVTAALETMGTEPGKSYSNNRPTYLFNLVCQVISGKTRKRYFISFLCIKSL